MTYEFIVVGQFCSCSFLPTYYSVKVVTCKAISLEYGPINTCQSSQFSRIALTINQVLGHINYQKWLYIWRVISINNQTCHKCFLFQEAAFVNPISLLDENTHNWERKHNCLHLNILFFFFSFSNYQSQKLIGY